MEGDGRFYAFDHVLRQCPAVVSLSLGSSARDFIHELKRKNDDPLAFAYLRHLAIGGKPAPVTLNGLRSEKTRQPFLSSVSGF